MPICCAGWPPTRRGLHKPAGACATGRAQWRHLNRDAVKFLIQPYTRCGPLEWTMTPAEVERELGPAERSLRNRTGHRVEFRFSQSASFIFDKASGRLVEVACSRPPSSLVLGDVDLNADNSESVARALALLDGQPRSRFGSIVFPALGVALTGYVPEDREIRAASAFAPGRWGATLA